MQCLQCGATVLKGDRNCRKCGTIQGTISTRYRIEDQIRSRWALVFRACVGASSGYHLRWLGYEEEARNVRKTYGFNILSFFHISGLIATILYHNVETYAVMLGKYRTDAQGHPVRYFRGKKKK